MNSIFPLLGLIGIGYFIYYLLKKKKALMTKKVSLFKAFADKNGLKHSSYTELTIAYNTLFGELASRPYSLREFSVGYGKSKVVITKSSFQNVKYLFDFSISKKGIFNAQASSLGNEEVKTGNEAFDKVFALKSDDRIKINQIVNESVQKKLVENKSIFYGCMENSGGTFSYFFQGSLLEEKHWREFNKMQLFIIDNFV